MEHNTYIIYKFINMSSSALKKTQTTLMYFHVYFNCVEEYTPNF